MQLGLKAFDLTLALSAKVAIIVNIKKCRIFHDVIPMSMVLCRLNKDPTTSPVVQAYRLCSRARIDSRQTFVARKSDTSEKEKRHATRHYGWITVLRRCCVDGRAKTVGQVLRGASRYTGLGPCTNRPRAAAQPRMKRGNENPDLSAFQ